MISGCIPASVLANSASLNDRSVLAVVVLVVVIAQREVGIHLIQVLCQARVFPQHLCFQFGQVRRGRVDVIFSQACIGQLYGCIVHLCECNIRVVVEMEEAVACLDDVFTTAARSASFVLSSTSTSVSSTSTTAAMLKQ
jgi:hypothetical protein